MGRKVSRKRKSMREMLSRRFPLRKGKRVCAAALCVTLTMGSGLVNMASAAGSRNSGTTQFELEPEMLYQAVEQSVSQGNLVDEKDLELRGKYAEDYLELLGTEEDSSLYEVALPKSVQEEYKDEKVGLRIFAKLDGEVALENDLGDGEAAGSSYAYSGDESLIFVLTNDTKTAHNARIQVGDKITDLIRVRSGQSVEMPGEEELVIETSGQEETKVALRESADLQESAGLQENPGYESLEDQIDQENLPEETGKAEESLEEAEAERVETAAKAEAADSAAVLDSQEETEASKALEEKAESAETEEEDWQETATDSNATPSDATSSDAQANRLEGELYDAVWMEGLASTAFAVSVQELGLNQLENLASASNAVEYYAEAENATVRAWAKRGVIPSSARLVAEALKPDDNTAEQHQKAADALADAGVSYEGMLAYDIYFDNNGERIEPDNGTVQVSIEVDKAALPENVATEDLAVQHLVEENHQVVKVEQVADSAENTAGSVEVTDQAAVAEFKVGSFSTFTITWGSGTNARSIDLHIVDADGNQLSQYLSSVSFSAGYGEEMVLANVAPSVYGYDYEKAYFTLDGSRQDITSLKIEKQTSGWPWGSTSYVTYYSNGGSDKTLPDGAVVYLQYSGSGPNTGTEITPATLSHLKTAVRRENGTYDLTLTVSATVGTESQKAQMDVLYILDKSGSMKENISSSQRIKRTKAAGDAISAFTNSLEANQNLDVRFSLVTFSGDNDWSDDPWNDASVSQGWTSDGQAVEDKAYPSAGGGTNYQAGIRTAKGLINGKRKDATLVVIFLSDGDPTFYYGDDGSTDGNGSTDDRNHTALKAAEEEIGSLQADYFYTIGVSGDIDNSNLTGLRDSAALVPEENRGSYLATDISGLQEAFDQIQSSVTYLKCSNVAITDTLSANVDVVKAGGEPEALTVSILDKEGKVVESGEGTLNYNGHTFQATYNPQTKQIGLDFDYDYELEEGYTYQVTAHVDATEAAYQEYRTNNLSYQDTPGEGTGTYRPGTDAGENGLFSNDSAKVTYTYNGEKKTEDYLMPVVQIDPGKLTIEKTIGTEGLTDEEKQALVQKLEQNLKFQVELSWPGNAGSAITNTITLPLTAASGETAAITGNEKGFGITPLKNDETGVYSWTIEGLSPDTTFAVSETDAGLDGYTLTSSQTDSLKSEEEAWTELGEDQDRIISKGGEGKASLINTYAPAVKTLTVTKKLGGNMAGVNEDFAFTLKVVNGQEAYTEDISYTRTGNTASPVSQKLSAAEDGTYSFSLKGDEGIALTLPHGAVITVTEANGDYEPSVTVADGGVGNTSTKRNQYQTGDAGLTADTAVTFTNTKDVTPPTGLFGDNRPYLLLMSAGIGCMGVGMMAKGWKKRRIGEEE